MDLQSKTKSISILVIFALCAILSFTSLEYHLSRTSERNGKNRLLVEVLRNDQNSTLFQSNVRAFANKSVGISGNQSKLQEGSIIVNKSIDIPTNQSMLQNVSALVNKPIDIPTNQSLMKLEGKCEEFCYVISVPWIKTDNLHSHHKCDWENSCSGCEECKVLQLNVGLDHDSETMNISSSFEQRNAYGDGKIHLRLYHKILILILVVVPPIALLAGGKWRSSHLELRYELLKISSGDLESKKKRWSFTIDKYLPKSNGSQAGDKHKYEELSL